MQIARLAWCAALIPLICAGVGAQTPTPTPTSDGRKAVLACMGQSVALESAYVALMAKSTDDAATALRRMGVPEAELPKSIEALRSTLAARQPKSHRDVAAIVSTRFVQCLSAVGVPAAPTNAAACYMYADVVRLIFKHKGEGANSLTPHLNMFEAQLVPLTALRAATTRLNQVDFEVDEVSLCLNTRAVEGR